MAMRTLTNSEVKVKSYRIHLMEMVINAIYYNPVCPAGPHEGLSKANFPTGFESSCARVEWLDEQILQLVVFQYR
jgi:hypothetical protein